MEMPVVNFMFSCSKYSIETAVVNFMISFTIEIPNIKAHKQNWCYNPSNYEAHITMIGKRQVVNVLSIIYDVPLTALPLWL